MTTISKLYVAPYRDINSDDYEVRARFYLDTERLPKPFQVTLKKDDGWNLDSGWFDVTIVPAKGVTVSKYLRLALLIMVGVSCILLFACECEP